MTEQLTEAEVQKLAEDWYKALDVHVPVEECLPMLSESNLEMVFPEATLQGQDAFKDWYKTVTHKFFDEVHVLKEVTPSIDGGTADVNVIVNWQAKVWNPPDAKSKWLGFDAYQTWVIGKENGNAVIVRYVVDKLEPMEGSATL